MTEKKIEALRALMDFNLLVKRFLYSTIKDAVPPMIKGRFFVLRGLENGEKTMSGIAEDMAVSSQRMTKIVDELEADGLVIRTINCENRREINVALTDKAKEVLAEAKSEVDAILLPKLEKLSDEEIERLHDAMKTAMEMLERI